MPSMKDPSPEAVANVTERVRVRPPQLDPVLVHAQGMSAVSED